ncbi:MAG: hypothetical protein IIU00_08425 [Clostridia bacterium]|nr:hypothetical protein [Clostridia bacterium]
MKKNMQKTIAILAVAAILSGAVASLASCGKGSAKDNTAPDQNNSSQTVQIANPWTEYTSLDEAVKGSGIPIEVPETVGDTKPDLWMAINGDMIEVRYGNAADIRKAILPSDSHDISGDYNDYAQEVTTIVENHQVTFKGNDGKVTVAIWSDDKYAYSVTTPGVTVEEMKALVAAVK